MLLSCTVQCYIDITTIAANVATIISASFVVTAVIYFFKNLVKKKNVKFILKEIMEDEEDSRFFFRIENYTDKNFYITQIKLDNINYIYEAKEIYQCHPKIYNLTDFEPISISAFECLNISPTFEIKKSQIHKKAKLIIQATLGKEITLNVFKILRKKEIKTDTSHG